jgi:hypothetical protein
MRRRVDRQLKRAMDVVLALLGLILGAPLMALLALAIRVDSPGRVDLLAGTAGAARPRVPHAQVPQVPGLLGRRSGIGCDGVARCAHDPAGAVPGALEVRRDSAAVEYPEGRDVVRGAAPGDAAVQDPVQGEFARVHDFVPGIFGPNQVAFRNESKMYPPDRDPETFYREELFPQKARQDIAYFSQATAFSDFLWILRGLWSQRGRCRGLARARAPARPRAPVGSAGGGGGLAGGESRAFRWDAGGTTTGMCWSPACG